ncbi:MAG TPA: HAD family hydrolase [Candidatus Saccharimonadales bacterium]|nr:HAD family hydrolase [Candidatus Saccharimonadales bacterium]
MTERIRVVLSDVDSTQIIHGQKLPSPAVQTAAHDLRRNGVYLSEATSRSYPLIRDLVGPLALGNNLCTLDGGATVAHADTGEVAWSHWLSPESTRNVVTSIGHLCTRIHFDAESRGRTRDEVLAAMEAGAITAEGRASIFAIFGVRDGDEILDLLGDVEGIHHTPIMDYKNRPDLRCIQVVNPGVDKQYGVEQMLMVADLSDARALAIGDGTNDFALFRAVEANGGVKVAMGNAPDELKDEAHWVAPSIDDHGFAVAMERYGLIS